MSKFFFFWKLVLIFISTIKNINSSLIGSLLLTFGPHVGKRRETKEEE